VISSAALLRAVIELNGGAAARLGIEPGDWVLHPVFGNAPRSHHEMRRSRA